MAKVETSRSKIVSRLEGEGWRFERHGADHDIYRHSERGFLSLPRHRTLTPGVARSIAKKAGWI
ncbi:MAG TPA: type II toxin-antitoxin system HicA family toxin [Beijerinckiaceae bacterium]|jgi:predicted RNA binding protein YcfA (HicA-like mRNA interferase family)|nr:type II toxin-antitoxin system HicA family toxin [Beijerinckiaceae bacterium]